MSEIDSNIGAEHIYARQAGEGATVVLLHGLFGSSGNLGALARHLQSDFHVVSIDLPGHGRSAHLPEYSLPELATSIHVWLEAADLRSVHLVGHSLGGKVAMQLALMFPEAVRSMAIADIAPVAYADRHQTVFRALLAVEEAQCRSRDEAQTIMARHLEEAGVIQFLLSGLRRDGEGVYRWLMDRPGLERDYAALRAAPTGSVTANWSGGVVFVKGANSDYIVEDHRQAITAHFPQAELKVIADSGHWLHAEQPRLFNGIVGRFLARHAIPAAVEGSR